MSPEASKQSKKVSKSHECAFSFISLQPEDNIEYKGLPHADFFAPPRGKYYFRPSIFGLVTDIQINVYIRIYVVVAELSKLRYVEV